MRIGSDVLERAQSLARHSDSPEHYTRTLFTPAHQGAARQLAQWMRAAGMSVRFDAIGSVIGRYEAAAPGTRTLLMGSHFDSVRNGGKYDGILGILLPLACVAELDARAERLPVAIEIAAFSDEEGARFQTSFLASRALIGRFDAQVLERRDAEGFSLADAMREVGLDPARVGDARIDPASLAAYVEVHIEQGPVLLKEGLPVGIVTTIAGGTRHTLRVRGEAGHAGTVPMALRHDALAAAAQMVLAVEQRCAAGGSLVGTVGILRVPDGTGNVIPGEVELSVDIRAGEDAVRQAAEQDVFAACESIAARRGVRLERTKTHEVGAVPCAGWLQDALAASVARAGVTPRRLASGAGHDAMIVAQVTDVGMLFVRCGAGGVSHNPAETIAADDVDVAAAALLDFLRRFEPRERA
ncbi:MAG TPA: allantoate amidohydrolase [Usitatibacter sp.]|jgi:hydantoinase/carbamoylase family amidase|nr:allantoate amidohydrolase [Usitatibacter sp.]